MKGTDRKKQKEMLVKSGKELNMETRKNIKDHTKVLI